jgi:hypothetical protein
VHLQTRSMPLQIIAKIVDSDRGETTHEIFKVKLNDQTEWAVDLAGAQFGLSESLTPWNEYKNRIVERGIIATDFGSRHIGYKARREADNRPFGSLIEKDSMEACWSYAQWTKVWVEGHSTALNTLLFGLEDDFETLLKDFKRTIGEKTQAWIKDTYEPARDRALEG